MRFQKKSPQKKQNTQKNTKVLKKNKRILQTILKYLRKINTYSKKILKYLRTNKNVTQKKLLPREFFEKKNGCTSHTEGPGSTGPGVFQWIWPILLSSFSGFNPQNSSWWFQPI